MNNNTSFSHQLMKNMNRIYDFHSLIHLNLFIMFDTRVRLRTHQLMETPSIQEPQQKEIFPDDILEAHMVDMSRLR
jgi:hypothetical protein